MPRTAIRGLVFVNSVSRPERQIEQAQWRLYSASTQEDKSGGIGESILDWRWIRIARWRTMVGAGEDFPTAWDWICIRKQGVV